MALGWHLVQIPFGHGRCPSHPDLILQLMFSRATNFPLRENKTAGSRQQTRAGEAAHTTAQCFAGVRTQGSALSPVQSSPVECNFEAPRFLLCPVEGGAQLFPTLRRLSRALLENRYLACATEGRYNVSVNDDIIHPVSAHLCNTLILRKS